MYQIIISYYGKAKNRKEVKVKEILFPGLNLKFEINSIAINIGNIGIYWYAIFIVIAFSVAILFFKKDNGKYGIEFEDIIELFIILIPVSIIFARIYFVIFNFNFYIKNPVEILNIRNGGLAIYGGIIGAIITILVFCKIKKINFLDVLDYIVPYLALGQAIGRWGNFFNGEAHGQVTDNILRMGIVENGTYIEVHPTFLYESICNFIIFIILFIMRNKRQYKGQLTFTYLTLYGLIRAIIEGLRTDSLMLGSFRISQVISILLFMVFGSILIYKKVKWKKIYLKNK